MASSSNNVINDTADTQLLPHPKLIANSLLQWPQISGISKIINPNNARTCSYTPVAQKATSLKLATSSKGKGVAMKNLCYNNKRQVKLCNFGYNKLAMKRLNKKQKRELATRYAFYNKILVKEALACIESVACVVSAGISPSSVDGN